jgi:ribosomal protein S21
MQVIVYNDFEQALKAFIKRVKDSGLLKELCLRVSFESRKEKRKRKDALALKRRRQRERRHDRYQ